MAKIFVRSRQQVLKKSKRPRYAIVAVEGLELMILSRHMRKKELEGLAKAVGAELVYLPEPTQDEQEEKPAD